MIGMMADKAHAVAAREIAPLCAKVIATTPSNPRATPAEQLAREMEPFCSEVWAEENPEEAFLLALREAQPEDAVLVCGSFYLASDGARGTVAFFLHKFFAAFFQHSTKYAIEILYPDRVKILFFEE